MDGKHLDRGGKVFTAFMLVMLIAAILPTRERDLYPFGDTGLTAVDLVAPDGPFPEYPTQILGAIDRATSLVSSIGRGAPAGTLPIQSPSAILPDLAPGAGAPPQLAAASPLVTPMAGGSPGSGSQFPGGLSIPSIGDGSGAAGIPSFVEPPEPPEPPGPPEPPVEPPVVVPVVPEPSTWLMMIAGFMAVGAAMRRRNSAILLKPR